MTNLPIIVENAIDGVLVRKGRSAFVAPPEPPAALIATPGDAEVALSWDASPSVGVVYEIRRVNISAAVWTGSGTSTTLTGLTNGVTYNFQVYAKDGAGRYSTPSNIATATPFPGVDPPPVSGDTIYGYNQNNQDTSYQTVAGRKLRFSNRVPCVRVYGTVGLTSTFTVSNTVAQELRVSFSFKAEGAFTQAQLASGAATATMINWLEDIPANWVVFWTYHHEPNSAGGLEVNATNFVNTYHQMRLALNAANLKTGVEVYICPNFMAYQLSGSSWSDAWVPSPADADILTWDIYGNPGNNTSASGSNKYGGPATGNRYDTTYALADVRSQAMFDIIERTGFADSWGVLELNAPLRNWDDDESGRVLWHQDMLDLFNAPPMPGAVPPKIVLLWEAPSGANWNQSFGYNTHPEKAGTNIAYNPASGSPMWGFWAPYITGTPVGG